LMSPMVLLNGIHSECFVFGFQSISETTSSMLHFTVQVSELHLQVQKATRHSGNLVILYRIIINRDG
jgi:hypothetical protein